MLDNVAGALEAASIAEAPLIRAASIDAISALILQASTPEGRVALFAACRACRDAVLRAAPTARLHLNLTTDEPHHRWQRRLDIASQCLSTRGTAPRTCLRVEYGDSLFTGVVMGLVCEGLRTAFSGVTELIVRPETRSNDTRAATYLIHSLGAALPSLTQLTVDACAELPAPPALPSLTGLTVNLAGGQVEAAAALCGSVRTYLPQLTSLHLHGYADSVVTALFTPACSSQTLTSLTLYHGLDDELVGEFHTPVINTSYTSPFQTHTQ